MDVISRRKALGLIGAVPLAGALLAEASEDKHAGHALTPADPNETARETLRRHYFPNVALRTHENKEVRFYDDLLKDKIVTINMIYTSCKDVCPLLTANLNRVYKRLGEQGKRVGRDIYMYSISIDPEVDTPQVLKKYVKAQGVGPGWTFLTGASKDIELLRRALGYEDPLPFRDKNKENHAGMVRYGNEPLTRWAMFQGMANPKLIIELIMSSMFI